MKTIIEKIEKEIDRLQCSTDYDPCSGLTVEPDDDGVRIFDDHADGVYDCNQLLEILQECKSATLNNQGTKNIWQVISPAQV